MRERDAERFLLRSDGIFDLYDLPTLNVSMRRVRPELDKEALLPALREAVADVPALPGIARIAAAERDEEGTYLIGPTAKGVTFADRIEKLAPLSPPVAIAMIGELVKALGPLHRSGRAHGDLRPDHLLFATDGSVVLQLPGICAAFGASRALTSEWARLARPYLAPELRMDRFPDPSSDLFAVGVVLFQLLTGRLPEGDEAPKAPAAAVDLYRSLVAPVGVRPVDADAAAPLVTAAGDAVRFGRAAKAKAKVEAERDPLPDAVVAAQEAPRKERDVPGCFLFFLALSFLVCAIMVGTLLAFDRQRPPLVKVPTLVGLSEEQAERVIKESKLRFVVASRRPNDKVPRGKILDSTPAAGARVAADSGVNVAVSDGPTVAKVPKLVGLTPEAAIVAIRDAGLTPTPLPDPVASDVAAGKVARQEPAEGSKMDRDGEVKFAVSAGKSAVGGPSLTAEVTVTVSGVDEPTRVRIDAEDAEGVRIVHDERHEPNDRIPLKVKVRGKTAVFRIYYDDRLVATIDKELTR